MIIKLILVIVIVGLAIYGYFSLQEDYENEEVISFYDTQVFSPVSITIPYSNKSINSNG